ncbi:uncharacterized protein KY384_008813 [Bacidia gigantensis]|uniref:uncharacterized protein n=1 Tax=Bacidia gigantensis TaxID=2732470 RepID=UPI001D058361|nr:uncharacterized protein KY384_008813 [Bacidia gigantensis]KAG8526612.1 hypothetical protein KY384_008813 [Bacidia gigantensis]
MALIRLLFAVISSSAVCSSPVPQNTSSALLPKPPLSHQGRNCDPYPTDFDIVQWKLTVAPFCQTAYNSFYTLTETIDTYDLILKGSGQPEAGNRIFAPYYFIPPSDNDDCAFTFYITGDRTEAPLKKDVAVKAAQDILDNCGYFGYWDIELGTGGGVRVQVMDGFKASQEQADNGNPRFPPSLMPGDAGKQVTNVDTL